MGCCWNRDKTIDDVPATFVLGEPGVRDFPTKHKKAEPDVEGIHVERPPTKVRESSEEESRSSKESDRDHEQEEEGEVFEGIPFGTDQRSGSIELDRVMSGKFNKNRGKMQKRLRRQAKSMEFEAVRRRSIASGEIRPMEPLDLMFEHVKAPTKTKPISQQRLSLLKRSSFDDS